MIEYKKLAIQIACVINLVIGCNFRVTGAINQPALRDGIEHVRDNALTKLGTILLFDVAWTRGRAFECADATKDAILVQQYDDLITKVQQSLCELLELRGEVVASAQQEILFIERIKQLLITPEGGSSNDALCKLYNRLRAWDDDLFEILEDIQRWLGLSEDNFALYQSDIQTWFFQSFQAAFNSANNR